MSDGGGAAGGGGFSLLLSSYLIFLSYLFSVFWNIFCFPALPIFLWAHIFYIFGDITGGGLGGGVRQNWNK